MQYNLIRNANFTVSGTTTLSYSNLLKLQDGNTTSSGVTVSGVTDLIVDLSQRIKVDGINLYAADMSQAANIYFYYKNAEEDIYTQVTTYSGAACYYSTISAPSAPQFIKVTTSGITIVLYEFEVLNDDYIVAYGEDGTMTETYLDEAPVGIEGTAQAIPIYNNSTSAIPVNAYTCIEYTGEASDYFIKLANTINGIYYGLEDGVLIEDNLEASTYTWDMGRFNRTIVASDEVVIGDSTLPTAFFNATNLGEIPLPTNTYSWRVGSNAWDYDPVSRTVYAIGNESNGSMKLYKLPLDVGSWSYIGEINPGAGADYRAGMCYLNGYIYVMGSASGGFGRYDLGGAPNNWTTLSGAGFNSSYVTKLGLCSDKTMYIYAVTYYDGDNSHKYFKIYDTTTDVWTSLSTGYDNAYGSLTSRANLAYDTERNYIYLDIGCYSISDYIQRYIVSSNTWNTTWLYTPSIGNASSPYQQAMTYYNNFIFLTSGYNGQSFICYYNTSTGQYGTLSTTFGTFWTNSSEPDFQTYLLATDGMYDTNNIGLFGAQLTFDRTVAVYWEYPKISSTYTYTSPVFEMSGSDMSSYFCIEADTSIAGSSISYNPAVYNGTIRVRSADDKPVSIYEVRIYYLSGEDSYVAYWSPYNDLYLAGIPISTPVHSSYYIPTATCGMCVDPVDGRFAIAIDGRNATSGYGNDRSYVQIYDRYNRLIVSTYQSGYDYYYSFNDNFEFEGEHGVWGYSNYNDTYGRILRHLDADLSILYSYSEEQQDFLVDMCTEKNGRGCWYTNTLDKTLVHMATNGTKQQVLYLVNPTYIAATNDNGCWVRDTVDDVATFVRYNSSGVQVSAFAVPYNYTYMGSSVSCMTHDFNNGIWYRYGDYIYHMTENGVFDVGPVFVADPNQLRGTPEGCFVHSTDDNLMYWVSMDGAKQSHSMPGGESSIIGMFYCGLTEAIQHQNDLIPVAYDPVWTTSGTAPWLEVAKDGYFLPHQKYHQVEITLQGNAKLEKIIMAPAIVAEDIPSGESRDIYLKTDIPAGTTVAAYEAKLRTWWGLDN